MVVGGGGGGEGGGARGGGVGGGGGGGGGGGIGGSSWFCFGRYQSSECKQPEYLLIYLHGNRNYHFSQAWL